MTGSVQTKKGLLYLVLNTKNSEGKRKPKWIPTKLPEKGNKREAERRLNNLLAEYDSTGYIEPSKELFCDYLTDWLEMHKANVTSITYAGYKRMLNQIYPYFKQKRITLSNLTAKHIQDYCTHKGKDANVGPNTVLKHLTMIGTALKYAKKTRLIKDNPAEWVEKPKKQKFIGSFYNKDESMALLAAMKGCSIETPLMFAIYLGLRRSEIVGIKWSAIDWTNKTLAINHKIVPVNDSGKYRLDASDTLKTKSSYRTMPLDDTFITYLAELKAKQEANKELCGNGYCYDYDGYVCVNDIGELITPNYISAAFKKLLSKNGLRHIRLHDLRHSCASLLLSLDYSLKDIQVWMGHGDIGTTMNIYAHVESSAKKGMMSGISTALSDTKKR